MIKEQKERIYSQRKSTELGLRQPTEVISAHHILSTEQDQYAVQASRIYFSRTILFLALCATGESIFSMLWWAVSFPNPVHEAWYCILISISYIVLLLQSIIQIYLWRFSKCGIFSIIWIITGVLLFILSQFIPNEIGFYLGGIGSLVPFVFLFSNIVLIFQHHRVKRNEENDAQKMIEFDCDSNINVVAKPIPDCDENNLVATY